MDTASYASSDAGVTVNLATGTGSGGHAQGDTISNFERILGSDHADDLTGNDQNNTISGGDDADTINGGGGSDFLRGEDGDDTINGGVGSDTIEGGAGADILDGGSAPNEFSNSLSYQSSDSGVTVNLDTGTASGGHAQGDTISNFGQIFGSAFNDDLTGNNSRNFLEGGDGNDILTGLGGGDLFYFETDEGADTITDFEAGLADEFIDLSNSGLSWGNLDTNNNNVLDDGDDHVSVGADTVIDLGGAAGGSTGINTVTVTGVTGLVEDDFFF